MPRPAALITGASSGLGAEFARQLAARGYDLVLVARRAGKLEALAAEVTGVAVEVLPADLCDPAALGRVERRIAALDTLELLVNNAGFGLPGAFAVAEPEKQAAMVLLHALAPVKLSRAALPGMIARGRGAIVNVSSVAAFFRFPGSANYCATKAYLNAFSEALQLELAGTGVRVQALCPGFTYTGFHSTPEFAGFDRRSIPRWLWLRAGPVVSDSLAALERGKVIVVPGWRYKLIAAFARSGLARPLFKLFARMRRKVA